jgi:NTP pyrophosphatase (non-canonical NTP hydrolase)
MKEFFIDSFTEMQEEVHQTAIEKGWWHNVGEIYANFHSEVSEAFTAWCKRKPTDTEAEELADVIIRIMDYAQFAGLDVATELVKKSEYNKTRSYRHGGKRA